MQGVPEIIGYAGNVLRRYRKSGSTMLQQTSSGAPSDSPPNFAITEDGSALLIVRDSGGNEYIELRSATSLGVIDAEVNEGVTGRAVAIDPSQKIITVIGETGVKHYRVSAGVLEEIEWSGVGGGAGIVDADYSVDGSMLAVSKEDGLDVYRRSGVKFEAMPVAGADRHGAVKFSEDQRNLLSVGGADDDRLDVFRADMIRGDTMRAIATPSIALGIGRGVAFSTDGDYLVIAHNDAPYITIYRRDGRSYAKLPDPVDLPSGNGYSVAFSPDGNYLAVGHTTTQSQQLIVYARSGDTFTKDDRFPGVMGGTVNGVSFSPDGVYLAVASEGKNALRLLKINGGSIDVLPNPTHMPPVSSGLAVRFSPDGDYLAVTHGGSPYLIIYQRNGDTFSKILDPDVFPTGNPYGMTFSPDGLHLVVAHTVAPFVTIYRREGNRFTKLPDPDFLPHGHSYSAAFSPSGEYLAIGWNSPPFVTIYKREGDDFIKSPDLQGPPSGLPRGVEFSPNGSQLAIAHAGAPYFSMYSDEGEGFRFAHSIEEPNFKPVSFDTSPDGRYLAVGFQDAQLAYLTCVYRRRGDFFQKFTSFPGFGADLQWMADGITLIDAFSRTALLRNGETFKPLPGFLNALTIGTIAAATGPQIEYPIGISFLYDAAIRPLVQGTLNTDALKIILLDEGASFNGVAASIGDVSEEGNFEVHGSGWPQGGATLQNVELKAVGSYGIVLTCSPVGVNLSGDLTAHKAVIYDSTTSAPIMFVDFQEPRSAAINTQLRIEFGSDGMISFEV